MKKTHELNLTVIATDNRKCTRYKKRSPDSSNDHSGNQEEKVSWNLWGLGTLQTFGPLIFAIYFFTESLIVANK